MGAYFIARVKISDHEKYKEYLKVTPAIIEKFGGKALARSEGSTTLEGPEESRRIIVIEFPSVEEAKRFYNSSEYRNAKKLREGAAVGEIIVVEGVK